MEFKISKPGAFLSQYIKQYWSMDNYSSGIKTHKQRIVPSGLFEIIFYFKDKPVSVQHRSYSNESIILTGQQTDYFDINITGNTSLLAVNFYPHGLAKFIKMPLQDLVNQSIPLKYLLKDTNQLEDKLYEAGSHEKKIEILEKYFTNLLIKNDQDNKYSRVYKSLEIINKSRATTGINQLASETCLSRKQFERVFMSIIGTSPKKFLKTIRFQNAIHNKALNPSLNLTEIAHKCGYFDQAHMIKEFKSLSGYTPKEYFKDSIPHSDYFN